MEEENNLICQSCGMPIKNSNDLGLEIDGAKSPYYCTYCYIKGEFAEPEITMQEMIEVCAKKSEDMGIMPYMQAKEVSLSILPQLKRWKYHSE